MNPGNGAQQLKNVQHPFTAPGNVATTVRLSERYKHMPVGQEFELWECAQGHPGGCPEPGCQYHGRGVLVGRWEGPLKNIPPSLLSIEHEPEARELEGLLASLRRGYGAVDPEGWCWVLIYYRRPE